MKTEERMFKLRVHFVGGGLSLREGDIVRENQLKGYADWLARAGDVEEVAARPGGLESRQHVRKEA